MSSPVLQAISNASASDIVTFEIHDNPDGTSSASQGMTLYASLDTSSGGLRWLQETRDGGALLRHLHTKKWLVPMLNDSTRNKMYANAIKELFRPTKGGALALDVGTGSGLLAMLVARRFDDAR